MYQENTNIKDFYKDCFYAIKNLNSWFWQGDIFIVWIFINPFSVACVLFFNSPATFGQSGFETSCPRDHQGS